MQLNRTRHCATGLSVTGLMVSAALLFGYVPTVVATEDLPRAGSRATKYSGAFHRDVEDAFCERYPLYS